MLCKIELTLQLREHGHYSNMPKPNNTNSKAKTKFHADQAHHATLHNIQP